MKVSATIAVTVGFLSDTYPEKTLRRMGHAITRCIERDAAIRSRLQIAAAEADETLFPSEIEVEVSFDERDIYSEDE